MKSNQTDCREHPSLPCGKVPSAEELSAMSAEELTQALDDAFDSMTEETYDDAVISAYLDALDQKDPMVEPDVDAELSRFWNTVVSAVPSEFIAARKRKMRWRRMLRTGLVAAAAVVLLFGSMVVAQAAGLDVFGAVARWTQETFHISVQDTGEPAWFEGHQEELEAANLSVELLPTWIPEGYVVGEILSYDLSESVNIDVIFSSSENHSIFDILISVFSNPDTMENFIFEKDSTPVQTFQVNGRTAYLFENLGMKVAVYQDQNVVYSIQGDLSKDQFLNILDSIGGR